MENSSDIIYTAQAETLDQQQLDMKDLTERLAYEIMTALDSQQAEILRLERFRAQITTAVNHSGIH